MCLTYTIMAVNHDVKDHLQVKNDGKGVDCWLGMLNRDHIYLFNFKVKRNFNSLTASKATPHFVYKNIGQSMLIKYIIFHRKL